MEKTPRGKKTMSKSKLIKIIIASVASVALLVAIPVYAWFGNQRKAAELRKIKYPNSLFLNAAYREDQIFFALDTIDISDVERDWQGNPILYKNEQNEDVTHLIEEKEYVFSVSGSNTEAFDLQLAHTNNNKFTYEIYLATPVSADDYSAKTDSAKNDCIRYETHPGKNTENTELVIDDDLEPDDDNYVYFEYGTQLTGAAIIEEEPQDINGEYKNNTDATNKKAIKSTGDNYYSNTYGQYINVEDLSVPLYWQAVNLPTSLDSDGVANKKDFCRYFILKVTWDRTEQSSQATKESDMVYLSVRRSNDL